MATSVGVAYGILVLVGKNSTVSEMMLRILTVPAKQEFGIGACGGNHSSFADFGSFCRFALSADYLLATYLHLTPQNHHYALHY
jgi:hypothetical protein